MDVVAVANLAQAPSVTPAMPADLVPDDLAAARFTEMMNPAAVAGSPPASAAAVTAPAIASVDGTGSGRTMGAAILEGMQKLSHEFQETRKAVHASLEAGTDLTMADALKLQMSLVEMSIQHEMVGKTISRSTQNIDQLVKMQ